MTRRALLAGCNYPGQKHALNGCVNDVFAIKGMLETNFGFDSADITILIDTDASGEQPTGANIKARLSALISATQPGDVAVFHYSGHGTQVPSDREEDDRHDEALCPTDMNVITDDDLRMILLPLPDGAKFVMIADCCHSGSLLDQTEVVISGPKEGDPEPPAQLADTFSVAAGSPDNREIGNRALPTDAFLEALAQKLGVPVGPGQVRTALASVFGADATTKINQVLSAVQSAADSAGVSLPGAAGGGGTRDLFGDLFSTVMSAVATELIPEAGVKPSPEELLPAGKFVLITGCQAHETSADACPSGDISKAFGALTNALTTAVAEFATSAPGQPISYRTLVHAVRTSLEAARFPQNPCLECSSEAADQPLFNP